MSELAAVAEQFAFAEAKVRQASEALRNQIAMASWLKESGVAEAEAEAGVTRCQTELRQWQEYCNLCRIRNGMLMKT